MAPEDAEESDMDDVFAKFDFIRDEPDERKENKRERKKRLTS